MVKTDTCWLWTGSTDGKAGYGLITVAHPRGKQIRDKAHRVSWVLHFGGAIPRGMEVCHTCDNPPCVRPDHLFLGTRSQNQLDARNKGRRGKLTVTEVKEMRIDKAAGIHIRELAAKYGVAVSTAYGAVNALRSWRDLPD